MGVGVPCLSAKENPFRGRVPPVRKWRIPWLFFFNPSCSCPAPPAGFQSCFLAILIVHLCPHLVRFSQHPDPSRSVVQIRKAIRPPETEHLPDQLQGCVVLIASGNRPAVLPLGNLGILPDRAVVSPPSGHYTDMGFGNKWILELGDLGNQNFLLSHSAILLVLDERGIVLGCCHQSHHMNNFSVLIWSIW